ncbi:MAG: hypothetical protein ACI8ZM_002693 [Crocinitomix sp.]|jgi:hypothetical protein
MEIDYSFGLSDLIALVLSVVAVLISFKNRRNNLRENLYDRQLDVFMQLNDQLLEITELLIEWGQLNETEQDKKDKVKLCQTVKDKIHRVWFTGAKYSVIMPDFIDRKSKPLDDFLKIILKRIDENNLEQVDLEKYIDITFDFQDDIRNFIGLEKLSRDNHNLGR